LKVNHETDVLSIGKASSGIPAGKELLSRGCSRVNQPQKWKITKKYVSNETKKHLASIGTSMIFLDCIEDSLSS
jgi:hypothetical protein